MLALAACGEPANEGSSGGPGGIDTLPLPTAEGSTGDDAGTGEQATSVATSNGTTSGADSTDEGGDGIKFDVPMGGDVGMPENSCQTDPNADEDGDGYSVNQGDCNDCDANVNPGAIEVQITEPDMMGVVPDPADEDCDGLVDNVDPPCDAGLSLTANDPYDAAAAIGLCKISAGATDWGIVDAEFVRSNGAALNAPLQNGIMTNFGPNVSPLEGSSLLVLSSGHARIPGQPNACNSLTCYTSGLSTAPAGFPQDVPACPGSLTIYDDIALEVTLRAPTNATGYAFSFDFYSFEYPEWVCTSFNDQFIALASPPPPGSINGNVSFDAMGNPVSVNIAFFDVCSGCPLGTNELAGTGFDTWNDAGATSWLATTAPVNGGDLVTIRFAIWDTGDQAWDSTALIDNFRWIADGGTVTVGTEPEG
ncbi:putative metal-binding motif-containing protein [Paraliomyxa miuraensis]|nr:putative metal-binding motif-containing protein [Paraliomyxa miuraensis]